MEMEQADLLNTVTNVLGLSARQLEVLSYDRYETISTIIHWKYDKISEWCTTKSNLTTTRWGSNDGDKKINCIQALAWWANNLNLRKKQIDLSDFDATTIEDCIDAAKLDNKDGKKDPDI